MWRPLWVGGGAIAILSCVTTSNQGVRLYDGARADGGAANLYGPIARVDGADVSGKGQAFEVRPACHLVTLSRDFGQFDAVTGGVSAKLAEQTFALEMRDGYSYMVERRSVPVDGSHVRIETIVRAVAPDGSSSQLGQMLAACP